MPIYDRSIDSTVTGSIGELRCLGQTLMHPGEAITARVRGIVDVAQLRDKLALKVHAR